MTSTEIANNPHIRYDVNEKPTPKQWFILSLQHLFAMFGSTILVPILTGLDPGIALLTSGIGTLVYILITKGQIPAYLGSSFAFIYPITLLNESSGVGSALVGGFLIGLVYALVALLVKKLGTKTILNFLPPVVVGPVIMVIGLGLASTAVNMAMYENPNAEVLVYSTKHITVALITLVITIICSVVLKNFFSLIPVLIGIIGGYITALFFGIVDFTPVKEAAWFQLPNFTMPFVDYTPTLSWEIILVMIPIAIVPISEHIGDQLVISKIAGRNFVEKPGLHRSLLGDGVSIMIASCLGGPPNTTYGENIGVMALTRVFSVYVIGGAAVFAILFGFIGKISALIQSIPSAVMGGVSILLFGIIASSGLRMLIDSKIDLSKNRNLVISSVILIIGVGGAMLKITDHASISGMALAAIVGVILNLVLPGKETSESQG
ncbi:uracil permease [Pradoshia sp. D12]|uniref:uracil permease n=1 Tax=Bacillaceae TaxID=186817 RepID=UPI00112D2EED|nr:MULTISPECIES: uracil permease [Bacillaceae]QFK70912.1 uracil permease [Pradoshia sp. D12]TPF72704.1 uracil permease [Bacillus sp. D12]